MNEQLVLFLKRIKKIKDECTCVDTTDKLDEFEKDFELYCSSVKFVNA